MSGFIINPYTSFGGGSPAPVLVQQAVGNTRGDLTFTFRLDAPVTPGNALIVRIIYDPSIFDLSGTHNVITSVVTGTSNDDSLIQATGMPAEGTGVGADIWYVTNLVGGHSDDSISITQANNISTPAMSATLEEWSGLNDAAPEDADVSTGLDDTPTTTNVFPSSVNNVAFAVGGWNSAAYSSGPTGGYTRQTQWDSSYPNLESADQIQTTNDPTHVSWTLTDSTAFWATAIAVFGAP